MSSIWWFCDKLCTKQERDNYKIQAKYISPAITYGLTTKLCIRRPSRIRNRPSIMKEIFSPTNNNIITFGGLFLVDEHQLSKIYAYYQNLEFLTGVEDKKSIYLQRDICVTPIKGSLEDIFSNHYEVGDDIYVSTMIANRNLNKVKNTFSNPNRFSNRVYIETMIKENNIKTLRKEN